jgi:hypothetical protein
MIERFTWKSHAGTALETVNAVGGATVIDCDVCRFRHIVPLPESIDLSQAASGDDEPASDSERYVFFERLWPDCRRRLLAVGKGLRSFVQRGPQHGWSVRGVEPLAKDGMLDDDLPSKLGVYDVIHVDGLLAHVPDPRDVLRLAFGLLEPRGLIAVTIPRAAAVIPAPHRVNYFDVASIQRLLGERFEVQAALTQGSTVTFVARKPAKRVTLGAGLA